jgi:DNA modification methylase
MIKPYYEDSMVQIFNADCREVLSQIDKVDLVLTDMPYGKETHEGARTDSGDTILIDFAPIDIPFIYEVFGKINCDKWFVSTMEWRHIAKLESAPP